MCRLLRMISRSENITDITVPLRCTVTSGTVDTQGIEAPYYGYYGFFGIHTNIF